MAGMNCHFRCHFTSLSLGVGDRSYLATRRNAMLLICIPIPSSSPFYNLCVLDDLGVQALGVLDIDRLDVGV